MNRIRPLPPFAPKKKKRPRLARRWNRKPPLSAHENVQASFGIQPTFVSDKPLGTFSLFGKRKVWLSVDCHYVLSLLGEREKSDGRKKNVLRVQDAVSGEEINRCTLKSLGHVVTSEVFPTKCGNEHLVAYFGDENFKELKISKLKNFSMNGPPPEFVLNFKDIMRKILVTKNGQYLIAFPLTHHQLTVYDLHHKSKKKKWILDVPEVSRKIFLADNNLVVPIHFSRVGKYSYLVYNLESLEKPHPIMHTIKGLPPSGTISMKHSPDGRVMCFQKENLCFLVQTLKPFSGPLLNFVADSPVKFFWSDGKTGCTWISVKDCQIFFVDFKNKERRILKREKLSQMFFLPSKFFAAGDSENMIFFNVKGEKFNFYNISKQRRDFKAKIENIFDRDFLFKTSLKNIICDETIRAI